MKEAYHQLLQVRCSARCSNSPHSKNPQEIKVGKQSSAARERRKKQQSALDWDRSKLKTQPVFQGLRSYTHHTGTGPTYESAGQPLRWSRRQQVQNPQAWLQGNTW